MKLIDTHCHIYSDKFFEDIVFVIERAKKEGVEAILMPNIDAESIDSMLVMEKSFPGYCIPMMGLHPCSVKSNFIQETKNIFDWFERRDFIAVGEVGLDLYWDKSTLKDQIWALEYQFELAMTKNIPAVIHCRDAFDELIPILRKYSQKGLSAVLHCFTGSIIEARECIDLGYYLGIGGVVTFKSSGLTSVLGEIGLEKIILETDAPYLAPVPHRGKRNEPAYVGIVAESISDSMGIEIDQVYNETGKNAERLFSISKWL